MTPDVTEERHCRPGAENPQVIVRQGGGFERTIQVSGESAAVVGACDGDLPLGVIVDAVAELMSAEAGQPQRQVLPVVRATMA